MPSDAERWRWRCPRMNLHLQGHGRGDAEKSYRRIPYQRPLGILECCVSFTVLGDAVPALIGWPRGGGYVVVQVKDFHQTPPLVLSKIAVCNWFCRFETIFHRRT